MSAAAYLLKSDFDASLGLERRYGSELWHVTGITGWNRTNTSSTVLNQVPARIGSRHPDPGIVGAICIYIKKMDGPWVSQSGDGTMEATVLVTYDSDRRWGGAGYVESGIVGDGTEDLEVPNFRSTTGSGALNNYFWSPIHIDRALIRRIEPRDASGITEAEKTIVFSYVGRPFNIYGQYWIMLCPSLMRTPTNQMLLRYSFRSKAAVGAFPIGPLVSVSIPPLNQLDEYLYNSGSYPPTIGVKPAVEIYGSGGDPTRLPYWNSRIVPI